jgi:hypothetical protein
MASHLKCAADDLTDGLCSDTMRQILGENVCAFAA